MIDWINLELTNRCNKSCPFCGRAKAREKGQMTMGDMPLELFYTILEKYPGRVIQFNKDGEPLLYQHLREVGKATQQRITNIVTNGLLLWDRREDIADNFNTVMVSVFEPDWQQFDSVRRFVEKYERPKVYIKFLGDYYNENYAKLGIKTTRRQIHDPVFDQGYATPPLIPELGICLDFLFKPSINWKGDFHICNRYDPEGLGNIGNVSTDSIHNMWYSTKRMNWLNDHLLGRRKNIPLCKTCEFWGVPTG